MQSKYIDLLFLVFILALPFSWANIGSMSIYRIVSVLALIIWLWFMDFKILIPNDYRKKYIFSWTLYVVYSIFAIVLYPQNFNIGLGMILLFMISLLFFSARIDYKISQYIDYMWLLSALVFIVLFLMGGSGLVGSWGTRETLVILGTQTDANEFSSFFIVALPIALYHILNTKSFIQKLVYSILLLIGVYIILRTGSRGALLSTTVAMCITFMNVRKTSKRTILVFLLFAVALVFVISTVISTIIPHETINRLSLEALLKDGGSGRAEIWTLALDEFFKRHPIFWIFGCGYGDITVAYSYGITSTMHNQFIQQLVSYGIVGLVLYCRLIYFAYIIIKDKYKRYMGPCIGLIFMSMTLTMGPSYKILWILLFIAGISNEVSGGEKNDTSFYDRRYRRRQFVGPA